MLTKNIVGKLYLTGGRLGILSMISVITNRDYLSTYVRMVQLVTHN